MKNILPFDKIFEMIYIGKIGLKDYNFVYDPLTNTGHFNVIGDQEYKIEIKPNGKDQDGKYSEFRIFSPPNKNFDLEELTSKIVYILNKNRLNHIFKMEKIVEPRYGLQPYSIISVSPLIEMSDFERLVSSTKTINKYVKKGGDFDQFTF